MPPSRSRSRSPRASRDERPRQRSRSPRRDNRDNRDRRDRSDRDRRPRRDNGFRWKKKDSTADDSSNRRLERGYRDRDDNRRKETTKDDVADKFGTPAKNTSSSSKDSMSKPPERAAPAPAAQTEPMIVVHVNDRLGTKAAVKCLPSDPIRLFKAMVAGQIGRKPHEILLKRQGERPFKDLLTLEDYGISNGAQLDLELDTGD